MDESLLEYWVAPISRQERENISVWNDLLLQPEIGGVREQRTDDQRPKKGRQISAIQNKAASSAVIALGPLWSAEKTMLVRSPLAWSIVTFLTYSPPSKAILPIA